MMMPMMMPMPMTMPVENYSYNELPQTDRPSMSGLDMATMNGVMMPPMMPMMPGMPPNSNVPGMEELQQELNDWYAAVVAPYMQ